MDKGVFISEKQRIYADFDEKPVKRQRKESG